MQTLTISLALISSIFILFSSPIVGLIVYIATFSWYPTYITIPVGTVDFTLRRTAIMVLFARVLGSTDLTKTFKFIWLDKIVLLYCAAQFLAGVLNTSPLIPFLENRCGEFLDTVLPYFAVRIIVRNKEQYLTLLKWILIIAAPLAIVGFYESLTGTNLAGFLKKYNAWGTLSGVPLEERHWIRYGFFRANTVFSHPIMFGLFFAMFGPICAGLIRNVKKHRDLCAIGLCLMGVGVFSSLSGGSWVAALLAVPFIACYHWRKYWKPVLTTIVLMCIIVEIISNRHFYDVFAGHSFNAANAWYRSRLVDIALFEGGMSGHWIAGFPFGVDPGWGPKIVGFEFTDMVNQYLFVLALYGLVGFIPFLAMNVLATKNLVDAFKVSPLDSDKWLIWCLAGSFWGIAGAFMTVSIYGPPITIYYMMIGFAGVMPAIVAKRGYIQHMVTGTTLPNDSESVPMLANNSRIHPLYKHQYNT